ncbi:MAG: hypothetical protein C5B55_05925 [Blastocatellia bacterium]|nr:MAG: hypothetical protein C5B55_05925 [Blastocatellia bacterium]
MYCTNCAAPLSNGLSYCNRCGASLKEKGRSTSTTAITAFLTAITALGVIGMGIMLGGSLVLRKEAGLAQELVAFFMLLVFTITAITEISLVRQLSRLLDTSRVPRPLTSATPASHELRAAPGEPIGSVTENTTRTLEYAHRERN